MPSSRVRTFSCRARTPIGQHGLDPRRDAGGVDDLLERRQRDHRRVAPSSRTASASPAGSQPGDQVAEPLGAADPGRVHERGQPQQVRAVGQPGRAQPGGVQPRQPAPAVQRSDQRVRQVPAARIGPAADQPGPGERRRRPAAGRGSGPAPAPCAPARRGRSTTHPAGPARRRRCRAHRAGRRGSARRRRPGRPARPPASAAPPWAGRPPAPGYPAISAGLYGCLGPLPGQRQVRRIQLRHDPAADEPQVRAQRPPRHAGQARRAPGEPLGHRRVQQHLRHRLQAQPDGRNQRACPPPTAGSSPAPAPPARPW